MKNALFSNNIILVLAILIAGCQTKKKTAPITNEQALEACTHMLTDVIVYDIFSPPVASRMYAYASLAYYEAIKNEDSTATSITDQLRLFKKIPKPNADQQYNFTISAVAAYATVSKALCFSKDSITKKYNSIIAALSNNVSKKVLANSIAYGESVGKIILQRAAEDNYKIIKGMPKYSVLKEEDKWQQTPPDYFDAVEPHWSLLQTLLIDSAAQIQCAAPPPYSKDKNSNYYKELQEVYTISQTKTSSMDSIATFWDDNPMVTQHKGHYTIATKKITPGGHWMHLAVKLCEQKKLSKIQTAKTLALTSCAIYDGFIACWYQKYKTEMPRPITVIRATINDTWTSYLQTPPFPEYTSGHSVITNAAAVVLEKQLGNNFTFTDSTEYPYLSMVRKFNSIQQAADEAGISRLYGGIHYRSAIVEGKKMGQQIGTLYITQIK